MHAVVNHLPIREDADWDDIAAKFNAFAENVRRDYPGLKSAVLMRPAANEIVFMGLYADRETADHVSSNVAGPWFAENIRKYLAGPAARSSGPVFSGVG